MAKLSNIALYKRIKNGERENLRVSASDFSTVRVWLCRHALHAKQIKRTDKQVKFDVC